MTSLIPAVGEALLHVRFLQRDLARSLQAQRHQKWESICLLSGDSMQELQWWLTSPLISQGQPVVQPQWQQPHLTIQVDASDTGWGVASPMMATHGYWTQEEKTTSINVRELKTILFALRLHAQKYANKRILLQSDNITALKYAGKAGGTASRTSQMLALEIQEVITSEVSQDNVQIRKLSEMDKN